MVRVIDYAKRANKAGETFYSLILQGGVELILSQETGRYYASAKRASITSTFDEQTCKSLIGSELPGSIQKIKCEEYEFIQPETGEVMTLNHRWQYSKEGETIEEVVFEDAVVTA